ncbi:MAG: T9SS type A sorting domain-containing protein [candidate division Zixibacteria bacterium]|nr:T9SS type A sorting domain-containing protein [candidate division Zixibacteria bacterium]
MNKQHMDRLLILGLAGFLTILSIFLTSTTYAFERVVVAELTSNTGCFPCFYANEDMDEIFPDYPTELVVIRYHKSNPDPIDPFYLFNPLQNTERFDYYARPGIPRLYIDGIHLDSLSKMRESIEARIQFDAPLDVNLSGSFNSDSGSGFLNVVVYSGNDEPPAYPLNLRVALTESDIYYPAPNGSNIHHQIFRGMIPDTQGEAFMVIQDSTYYFFYEFNFSGFGFDYDECQLSAFVQNDTFKVIHQGDLINLSDMDYIPPQIIEIEQPHLPIYIPQNGGQFTYTGLLQNNTAITANFDVWTMLILPDSSRYGPLDVFNLELDPLGSFIDSNIVQVVPGTAVAGTYSYHAYIGIFPDLIYDSTEITFVKLGMEIDPQFSDYYLEGWGHRGVNRTGFLDQNTDYNLECSPNPCNPNTIITFNLNEFQNVKLDLYNVHGQKISGLIDRRISPGKHAVNWNGAAYSSGIYFLRLQTDNNTQHKKLVLLK